MPRVAPPELPPGSRLPAPAQTFVFWKWPLAYLERNSCRYGSRFTLRATNYPPLVFLSDPADMKTVMAAPADVLHPGKGAATVEPLVGEQSFMLSEGEDHLVGRRALLPAFHGRVVQRHSQMVVDAVRREVASWPRGVPFALHPRLRALTLEVILRTVFGASATVLDERLRALRDRLLEMLSVTESPVFPEPLLRHGPGRAIWERFLRARSRVDELMFALIDERPRSRDGATDALEMLLDTHNPDGSELSRKQVRDNLMSIVIAGHETTASELAWAFQLLAHNPAVLERLVAEIDRGSSEEYLTATVQEVLRHRPVFLFAIPRSVARPIEIGGWSYRPPAQLLGCIYLAHHDPSIYLEPYEFRPERFLGEPPRTSTWLPWGGGRKRCPGLHLAVLEMRTVLRAVLSELTLHPASRRMEHPRWRSVIVTPHAGARVVLQRRRSRCRRANK